MINPLVEIAETVAGTVSIILSISIDGILMSLYFSTKINYTLLEKTSKMIVLSLIVLMLYKMAVYWTI